MPADAQEAGLLGQAVGIAAEAVVAVVPLLLAGLGELVAQRSGVINVGIEGLMLSGCIAGFATAAATGSAWLGLAAAIVAAAALAALFAIATVWARVDQIVAGMAINLLVVGGSGTIWQILQQKNLQDLRGGVGFERSGLPLLGGAGWDLPVVGPVVLHQYGLCYATLLLAVGCWWMLRATRAGVIVQALGDAPDACAAAGIEVRWWRTAAVLLAGGCAGAAGAYLSIMRTHSFATMMTGGTGFVVLALVIFGRWRVGGLAAGCLGFGVLQSLQQHFQGGGLNQYVPHQAFEALPYVVALLALGVLSRGAAGPAQLGRPWPER